MTKYFKAVTDPRLYAKVMHDFAETVMMGICAEKYTKFEHKSILEQKSRFDTGSFLCAKGRHRDRRRPGERDEENVKL